MSCVYVVKLTCICLNVNVDCYTLHRMCLSSHELTWRIVYVRTLSVRVVHVCVCMCLCVLMQVCTLCVCVCVCVYCVCGGNACIYSLCIAKIQYPRGKN